MPKIERPAAVKALTIRRMITHRRFDAYGEVSVVSWVICIIDCVEQVLGVESDDIDNVLRL
ncbi:MAG: hypothetical protein ABJN77_16845 [Lentilitoribacter sp.]